MKIFRTEFKEEIEGETAAKSHGSPPIKKDFNAITCKLRQQQTK